ncbi:MAG: tetratricopeptide repeat protein [Elusimicrobiaceae bacterium]|nr:tetratricopeptide repeat protein [Elusimicrobiaceae bacterium]
MEYSKRFFKFCVLVGIFCWVARPLYGAEEVSCLDKGKQRFAAQQYREAVEQFSQCTAQDPKDVDAQLSLAGALLTLDQLSEAEEHFNLALKNMKRNSPYWAYTYSMLGDIALKKKNNDLALEMYNKSLEYNPANVNSRVGKGIILEYQGDKKAASQAYQSALAVEPLNLIARKRLINLEPDYFSDEEILNALKQRYVIAPETTTVTEKEKKLFRQIHRTEQRRGIDYLKGKFPKMPPEYIITLNKDTDFSREILSYSGYQALQKSLGQDAVAAFQQAGVPIKDVFSLRDRKGNPVFDEESCLTDEGLAVYSEFVKNPKNKNKPFLLPNQDVPPSAAVLQKTEAAAQHLKDQGFVEISRAEYAMLQKETLCSPETLKDKMDVRSIAVTKHRLRYFVQSKEQTRKTALKGVPYYYVMQERAKKDPTVKVPKNAIVESYKYFGNGTICLDDGNLLYADD